MALTDYSTNPANNGVVAGISYFPEGMLPSGVDDAGRQVMADIAQWLAAPSFSGTLIAPVLKARANATGHNIAVGDDVWIGDRNITSGMSITGQNDETSGYIQFGNVGTNLGVTTGGPLCWGPNVLYHAGNLTGSVVTSALGYTPYNSSNPNGYISGITSLMVTNALGYTPYYAGNFGASTITNALGFTPYPNTNPSGFINGISQSMVTGALGYTPANVGGQRFSGDVGRSGSAAGDGFVLGLYNSNPMYELGGTDTGIYLDIAAGRIKVRVLGVDVASFGTDGFRTIGNIAAGQGGV